MKQSLPGHMTSFVSHSGHCPFKLYTTTPHFFSKHTTTTATKDVVMSGILIGRFLRHFKEGHVVYWSLLVKGGGTQV